MTGYDFDFDPATAPASSFAPIPAGWYSALLTDIQKKDAKTGNGWYFELSFQVDERRHPGIGGRRLFARLNLGSNNEKAVEIAKRQLAELCNAAGIANLKNTDQLLNGRAVALKVTIREASGDYEASNEIKAFDAISARFKDAKAPAAASAKPGSLPWE